MSRGLVFAVLVAAVGCTESTPNSTRPPPKTAVSASMVDAAPASPTAPAIVQHPELADAGEVVTIPESKPTWRSTPKETNGFYPVLDGLCSKLGMGRVGKDVIVYYGGSPTNAFLTNERWGMASFIALKDTGLEPAATTREIPLE